MSESNILVNTIGAINTNEVYVKVQVNCSPQETNTKSGLENPEYELLYPSPSQSSAEPPVPLIGGAVVKIKLGIALDTFYVDDTTNKDSKSKKDGTINNDDLLAQYDAAISKLRQYASTNISAQASTEPLKISELVRVRNKINKALEEMPSISSKWKLAKIPRLGVATYSAEPTLQFSGGSDSFKQRLADSYKTESRLDGLRGVGEFKFIPIEVIKNILSAIIDGDNSLKNYIGFTGKTFSELYAPFNSAITEDKRYSELTDALLKEIMLEILPILRLSEQTIEGDERLSTLGYYTAHGDSLYVKMPDMSARNSSGFSENIFNIGLENPDEKTFLLFEMIRADVSETKYGVVPFNYFAPPSIDIVDEKVSYPSGNEAVFIQLDAEGLSQNPDVDISYFLSPIASTTATIGSKSFKIEKDAIEIFTFPAITKPFITGGKPQISSDNEGQLKLNTSYKDELIKYIKTSAYKIYTDEYINGLSQKNLYDFGYPLSISLSKIGVSDLSDLLGEYNRPEILLGSRDGDSFEQNDLKYFDQKILAAREIMASVRPNIIEAKTEGNYNLPDNWLRIPQQNVSVDEDNIVSLKITKELLKDFSDIIDLKFALYAIDSVGQIVRAPGKNIEIVSPTAQISIAIPNGFKDKNKVITLSLENLVIEIQTEDVENIDSFNLYTNKKLNQGSEIKLKIGIDINLIKLQNSIRIQFLKILNDIIPNTTGYIYIASKGKNGKVSKGIPIYIASDGTTAAELPEEPPKDISFENPFDTLSVPKFVGAIDSVPILLDGQSALINIRSKNRIFEDSLSGRVYGYIIVANDSDTNKNYNIINDDIGWIDSGDGARKVSVQVNGTNSYEFFAITAAEYELGTSDFSIKNKRNVSLKFPGSFGNNVNFSRFTDLNAPASRYPAYILITSKKLSDGSQNFVFNSGVDNESDYAIIPIGSMANAGKPAFINPPHVLGLIAELPGGGDSRAITNIEDEALGSIAEFSRIENAVSNSKDYNYQIISSDALDQLTVVFNGTKESRMSKLYSFKIGNKKIPKSNRVTKIFDYKYNDKNLLITNFRDIFNIQEKGWIDVIVTKKDKKYNVTYDSVLYNRTTLNYSGDDLLNNELIKLVSESSLNYTFANGLDHKVTVLTQLSDGTSEPKESTIILPDNKTQFSSLPLIIDDNKLLYKFKNPIRIYPKIKLGFGDYSQPKLGGLKFTDSVALELSIIDIDGKSVSGDSSRIIDGYAQSVAQGNSIIDAAKKAASQLDSTTEEFKDLSNSIADSKQKLDSAAADAGKAIEESGLSNPEALTGAVGVAQEGAAAAVGAINDVLSLVSSITDVLSSLTQLANKVSGKIEDATTAISERPSEIVQLDLTNILIPGDSIIPSNKVYSNALRDIYKLILDTKYSQTSSIRFNVPEIISITKDKNRYTKNNPDKALQLSNLLIKTGDEILIETIGTSEDTKFEIAGKRVTATLEAYRGIFVDFKIKIPNLEKIPTFGSDPCITIAITNSNENRVRAVKQLGNNFVINLEKRWKEQISGGGRNKSGQARGLKEQIQKAPLRFTSVLMDKAAVAKDFINSFCDFSFSLTAELQFQLRNFKVLLVPIKVIFCIIDVICALLNPVALVFAIIRLFLCLYDLILLLPQLSVPAMFLALALHILELIFCVIFKILSTVNAINEIIAAIETAIEEKNYQSIVALEETLNEHLLTIEADLSVFDPILSVLGIFMELLQLTFAFPCSVAPLDDEALCIDASQLANLVIGKIAPKGSIEPDALIPVAQTYTLIPIENIGTRGNTPPDGVDPEIITMDPAFLGDFSGSFVGDPNANISNGGMLIKPYEMKSSVIATATAGDTELPGLINYSTGENALTSPGSFFADVNASGEISNIDYTHLRFNGPNLHLTNKIVNGNDVQINSYNDFQATFGISFTKSVKRFAIFTGPDPRIVEFKFNSTGETNSLAFASPLVSLFFKKKTIDILQTLDSPPNFLQKDGANLRIADSAVSDSVLDFVSPIDGSSGNYFITKTGSSGSSVTYTPKPLTITLQLQQAGVNQVTSQAEFTPVTVTKTFGNIPMVALVDEEFNVYFIQEDGIKASINQNGVWEIESISAKMINFPSAPKKSTSFEEQEVFEYDLSAYLSGANLSASGVTSANAATLGIDEVPASIGASTEADGSILIKEQANADALAAAITGLPYGYEYEPNNNQGLSVSWSSMQNYFLGISDLILDFAGPSGVVTITIDAALSEIPVSSIPYPGYNAKDWSNGNNKERKAFNKSIDTIKVLNFPRLYMIDMRQLSDEIAAACNASGPSDLLLDLPGFGEDFGPTVTQLDECIQSYLNFFTSNAIGQDGEPIGVIEKIRSNLAQGVVPQQISIDSVIGQHDTLQACIEDVIDKSCRFVVNPLNSSFKLTNDLDITPLEGFVNPEQTDSVSLINNNILDQTEFDQQLEGLPNITGAMEYASGIGDTAIVEVGTKAIIEIIPRDCYDAGMPESLDLTQKIRIDFISDETTGAKQVPVIDGQEDLIVKNGNIYTLAISSASPGKVTLKGSICFVNIQAVTDRGIITETTQSGIDCVPGIADISDQAQTFAPGALTKVDRILTILFVTKNAINSRYGDGDRDASSRSPKTSPQTFGTRLEN
jgi:hypothetical protein